APPAGDWTADNDFYVYHGAAECTFPGGVTSGHETQPGDYYRQVPSDAVHLLSAPRKGNGLGDLDDPRGRVLAADGEHEARLALAVHLEAGLHLGLHRGDVGADARVER